jgi:hypothetical protein
MVESELWRNQLELGHPARNQEAWRRNGVPLPSIYRPDVALSSGDEVAELAERALEAQQFADPTIFVSPSHYLPGPQVGVGRSNDLAISAAYVGAFRRAGLEEPHPGDMWARPRGVFVGMTVDFSRLAWNDLSGLVDEYASLDGHGFVLWVANFNGGIGQAQMLRAFARELEAASSRPVVIGGVGHWHTALLHDGLAATCVGPQRGRYPLLPDAPDVSEDERRRATFTYHGAVLSAFGLARSGVRQRNAVFALRGCACGFHQGDVPPTGVAIRQHNQWWLSNEARNAAIAFRAGETRWLTERRDQAIETRGATGMTALARCWNDLPAFDAARHRAA